MTKTDVSLESLLGSMREKLFGEKEPFLIHLLRKELGKQVRKDLRQNLRDDDIIIYLDFSKGSIIVYMCFCIKYNVFSRARVNKS